MKDFLIYGALTIPLYLIVLIICEDVLGLPPSGMFFAGGLTGGVIGFLAVVFHSEQQQ